MASRKKFRVLITAPSVIEEEVTLLEKAGAKVQILSSQNTDEVIEHIRDKQALIVGVLNVTEEMIKQGQKLQIIAKHGTGYDNIAVAAATDNGIYVTNTPGANAWSVAEYAFGLILALVRKIPRAEANMKSGGWREENLWGYELYKKKIGIIGFGHIGNKVAKIATRGFGMEVLVTDPYIPDEKIAAMGGKSVELDTLLKESDIVSIHSELTKETEKLIGEKELSLMKKDSYLINVARGPIVDKRALYNALKEKTLGGAAVDVFHEEPPSNYSLVNLPNVVATPHIAAWTKEARTRMALRAAKQVIHVMEGKRPEYPVNEPVLD